MTSIRNIEFQITAGFWHGYKGTYRIQQMLPTIKIAENYLGIVYWQDTIREQVSISLGGLSTLSRRMRFHDANQ